MIPFPDKEYDIIYADPAWNISGRTLPHGDITVPYNTMKTGEIKAIPVETLTSENCLLFMWVVNSMLEDAFEVGKAWGFQFSTVGFIWEKQEYMPGGYNLVSTEQCFIFRKGNVPEPRGKRNIKQFLSCKRGRHSEKPKEIRHRITEMFPTQSKIELFARPDWTDYDRGWDYWGNEV